MALLTAFQRFSHVGFSNHVVKPLISVDDKRTEGKCGGEFAARPPAVAEASIRAPRMTAGRMWSRMVLGIAVVCRR